ncbi:4-hydroxyphenylpyruvate dioxygenase [Streptomyces zhaozhouensis]|uniref:4-hydroxyphenylpyruvate dioxygenase n=1 Tax=Streptomyces zhaozhouensis TaxID=1300267 RepID=A0A286E0K9_9ACTN|nr:4-hydroxyphenylpyruvate dioxygenase [Streptomyces zhaozhouensis]SOD64432.1 4-hydroxyphenylpyruvate dioxygenase [Streptomyces zhaozhouensis]
MSLTAVAFSELYVAARSEAVAHLVDGHGFVEVAVAGPDTGAPDVTSTALRREGVTLVVTQPLDDDGEVARYVDRHGDSIADIAFLSTDVERDHARAVAGGADSLGAPVPSRAPGQEGALFGAVSGFGDLRHTLVGDTATTAGHLPPDREWTLLPAAGEPPASPPARPGELPPALDHIAVCLEAGTLRDTVAFYESAFDIPYYSSEYIEVGSQAMDSIVVRNATGGITFTFIEPDPSRDPGQIDQFLTAHAGAGVQHLAFHVDDIIDTVRQLSDRGVAFLRTPGTYYEVLEERVAGMGERIADLRATNVLVDRDEWGYLLQIFARSPYPRGTLFYEYVQRNGARGFGSSNIKALYEAVERAREAAAR